MKMLLFILLVLILFLPQDFRLYLGQYTQFAQFMCIKQLPASPWSDFYSAIVCGKSTLSQTDMLIFKKTGLIHLLIVSGSHLIFINYFLKSFGFHYARTSFLFIYILISGAQPPALRAFLQIIFSKLKLQLQPAFLILASSLFTLFLIKSHTLTLLSLQLSWGASLSLTLANQFCLNFSNRLQRIIIKQIIIWLTLTPLLLNFSAASPHAILANLFIAPLIGWILFPLSILSCLFHPLVQFTDIFWELTLNLVTWFSIYAGRSMRISMSECWPWIWLSILTLVSYFNYCGRYGRYSIFKLRATGS